MVSKIEDILRVDLKPTYLFHEINVIHFSTKNVNDFMINAYIPEHKQFAVPAYFNCISINFGKIFKQVLKKMSFIIGSRSKDLMSLLKVIYYYL